MKKNIRHLLPQTFGKVPYLLMTATPPLPPQDGRVFAALDWHGSEAWPSTKTLCAMANLSRREVFRSLKRLTERGFLRKHPHRMSGGTVLYFVDSQPSIKWKPASKSQAGRAEREGGASQSYGGSASQAPPSASQSPYLTPLPTHSHRTPQRSKDFAALGVLRGAERERAWEAWRQRHGSSLPASEEVLCEWWRSAYTSGGGGLGR